MKVSELIQRLKDAKLAYGDLPVIVNDSGWGKDEVSDVKVWTESGNYPDGRKKRTDPAVEIQIF